MTPAQWAEAIRRFVAGDSEWEWLDEGFDEDPLGHVVLGPKPEGDNDEGLQAIVSWDKDRGWHLFVIDIESGDDVCEGDEHLPSRRAAMMRGEAEIVRLARKRLLFRPEEKTEQWLRFEDAVRKIITAGPLEMVPDGGSSRKFPGRRRIRQLD